MRLDVTFVWACVTAVVALFFILQTSYDEIVYDGVTVTTSPLLCIEYTSLLPNIIVVVSQRVEGIINQHVWTGNLSSLNRILGDLNDDSCVLRGDE